MRRGLILFLGFSGAIFLSVYLLPPAIVPWLSPVCLLPVPFLLWRRRRAAIWALIGAAIAFLWFFGYRALFFTPAEDLAGRRAEVVLYLSDYPEARDFGARAEGYVVQPGKLPVKTLFYGPDDLLELGPGDKVTVTADCSLSTRFQGREVRYYVSRGIFLLATARGTMEVVPAQEVPWWCLPSLWAHTLQGGIRAALPEDVSGFFAALVTGDRSGLSEAMALDLSRTGASHIVAVSGLHVCFLVGLVTWVTGWYPKRRAAVCIPVLILFALTVGSAPSVLRASFMQFTLLIAPLVRREADGPTSLSLALSVLLALNPYSAGAVGLQLSFLAALGLIVITPRIDRRLIPLIPRGNTRLLQWLARLARFLARTLSATLGALAFSLPVSLYHFQTFSLVSPLVNLLILPVVSLLFCAGLLLGLLALVAPEAAWALGLLPGLLGRYVIGVIETFSAFPFAAVTFTEPCHGALVIGLYALLLIALLYRSQRRRTWVFLAAGSAMAAGAILFTALAPRTSSLTVTVLDVGQGQSVAITSKGHTALVDCGGSGLDDPGDVAANYFQDRGFDVLDLLVLTHFHDDHAGGLEALFRRMDVKAVAIPDTDQSTRYRELLLDLCEAEGCDVRFIDQDTVRTLGDAALTLYAPLGDGGANEEGLSVLASLDDFDLLLTGDMNTVVEERLVKYGHLPDCEVLVAGHHGSRYATGDVLLDAIDPEVAVISVGVNSYGHPAQDTLDRLRDRDVTVYRTDQMGNITLQVG